jgi:hypothetical protein
MCITEFADQEFVREIGFSSTSNWATRPCSAASCASDAGTEFTASHQGFVHAARCKRRYPPPDGRRRGGMLGDTARFGRSSAFSRKTAGYLSGSVFSSGSVERQA